MTAVWLIKIRNATLPQSLAQCIKIQPMSSRDCLVLVFLLVFLNQPSDIVIGHHLPISPGLSLDKTVTLAQGPRRQSFGKKGEWISPKSVQIDRYVVFPCILFELATEKNRLPVNLEDAKLQHQAQIVYRLVYERFILGSMPLSIHQIPRTIGHRFRPLMFPKREAMTRNTPGSISRRSVLGWACSFLMVSGVLS